MYVIHRPYRGLQTGQKQLPKQDTSGETSGGPGASLQASRLCCVRNDFVTNTRPPQSLT
jgi:hypothetical protein